MGRILRRLAGRFLGGGGARGGRSRARAGGGGGGGGGLMRLASRFLRRR